MHKLEPDPVCHVMVDISLIMSWSKSVLLIFSVIKNKISTNYTSAVLLLKYICMKSWSRIWYFKRTVYFQILTYKYESLRFREFKFSVSIYFQILTYKYESLRFREFKTLSVYFQILTNKNESISFREFKTLFLTALHSFINLR